MQANLEFDVVGRDWPSIVVGVIQSAQTVGYGWGISNSIEEEVHITSERFSISGLTSMTIYVSRESLAVE